MDWSDDVDISSGDTDKDIKIRESARRMKEGWMIWRMCRDEVESLISHVDGRSVAGAVVECLIEKEGLGHTG